MELQYLERAEIIQIYEHLVADFAQDGDPISPAGVRDDHLLESAISRQFVGQGRDMKYPTPVSNAATLAYGLCNNHPFYNGNKRCALVSILVHLDKNKLSLWGTSQDELYEMILAVAKNQIAEWVAERLGNDIEFLPGEDSTDVHVRFLSSWLSQYVAPVRRGERSLKYRDLRKLIQEYGYDLQSPAKSFIRVVKLNSDGSTTNVDSIVFPGMARDVDIQVIKRVRERCRLREEDGVDTDAFYGGFHPIDEFINKYRLVLRRLADT
ncbi:type II toxin-antitoxin system death-on-curing family toxin [Streptomyces sp. NPDC001714]|uniref:type II toxin-antitoxin system death-on-curing family toxin n=1 Tax=Streptomyces sp. NPDC001714 TaxID=3364603 RepID=UPI003678DAE8